MIKIDHVEYGVQPYGVAMGYRMLGIYFGDDDEVYDFTGLDDDKDSDKIRDMYASTAQKLFDTVVADIKEQGLTEIWNKILECKQLEYIGFIGNAVVDDYYFYVMCMFQQLVTKAAIQRQELSEEFAKARAEHRMPRMQPPHVIVVANPLNPMIQRNPWELGEINIGKLTVNKEENYHINSMANIANSTRGRFVFNPTSMEDVKKFEKFYPPSLFPRDEQLSIQIDTTDDDEKQKIAKWAMSKGYRHMEKSNLVTCIDFDFE